MKTYLFTVKDSFFPQTFSGEIEATNMEEAEKEIKSIYAYELDTEESELTVSIQEKVN